MLDVPLLIGKVPVMLPIVAFLGLMWLLARPPRTRSLSVLTCASVAAAVTVALGWLVTDVLVLFPDRLEARTCFWIGFAIFAALLVPARLAARRHAGSRALTALAAITVIAASANGINVQYEAFPTLRSAIEPLRPNEIPFPQLAPAPVLAASSGPLDSIWRPPARLSTAGRTTRARIPGTASGFNARTAEIYLPPAYFATPRPLLPVLVLLAGQPGSPEDWLASGNLVATMDDFAATHRGLAPIVVVADGTGGLWKNPLCADTTRGRAATYLSVDVPKWIRANLTVDPNPRAWAIAGASYGGTCATQLALAEPGTYPTFLSMSGESQPSLGNSARTLRDGFGGDKIAFARADPLALLRARPYPDTSGIIAVGSNDGETAGEARKLTDALRNAGVHVRYLRLPGGHDWGVWSAALKLGLPWLAQRLGLTT